VVTRVSFLLHAVPPPLNAYINFLYVPHGPMRNARDAILPMPSTDLKFNFGDPWRVHEPSHGSSVSVCEESWFLGVWNRHHVVEWPAQIDFIGVNFKPGGAYPFVGMPLAELHNRVVPLDAIWGRFSREVRERLHAATTAERRFALAEQVLLARLGNNAPPSRLVDYAIKQIAYRHGALRIGDLCDEIGVSPKHLITLFKRDVGCTPKQLARLHRFGHTLESIDVTRPVDWTSVAHENEYFDQSHFSRDFEAHTGLNPSAYLKLRQGLPQDNPVNAAMLGLPS
jgi:AraC-like DNA-binding protein